ncbi:MAG: isoprenylcysteine carboxylmethyltransferase family protein [Verrucomicrobiota bacterium]
MATELLTLNRTVVFLSALVYWSGVLVQARRVRRRIGRSPNVRPQGLKEKLLWAGWSFVVLAWLALPFLIGGATRLRGVAIIPSLVHPLGSALGVIIMVLGYAGTLWCYIAMGSAWRMGVIRTEETHLVTRGPYRLVRHPIYLFQIVMVAAIAILLPSALSSMILVIHLLCVLTKAADEESHLRTLPGQSYEAYCANTGRWFPKLRRRKSPTASLSAADRDPLKSVEQPLE